MTCILIVEDEPQISSLMAQALRLAGFEVAAASDATCARKRLFSESHPGIDLVLLDINLPGPSGWEVIRELPDRMTSPPPVIIISAIKATDMKVYGLDMGAEDFLVKPFALAELVARVRSVLRRRFYEFESSIGPIRIDRNQPILRIRERHIEVNLKEWRCLKLLAAAQGAPVSSSDLTDELWGDEGSSDPSVLQVFVSRLRKKVGVLVASVRGQGYRLHVVPKEDPPFPPAANS